MYMRLDSFAWPQSVEVAIRRITGSIFPQPNRPNLKTPLSLPANQLRDHRQPVTELNTVNLIS